MRNDANANQSLSLPPPSPSNSSFLLLGKLWKRRLLDAAARQLYCLNQPVLPHHHHHHSLLPPLIFTTYSLVRDDGKMNEGFMREREREGLGPYRKWTVKWEREVASWLTQMTLNL